MVAARYAADQAWALDATQRSLWVTVRGGSCASGRPAAAADMMRQSHSSHAQAAHIIA